MLFDSIDYNKKISELHALFYNGRLQYFSGSGFIVDFYQGQTDCTGFDINDPYVVAKAPADAVKYLREFVSSCQNHVSYFSHPALQRLMGEEPMNVENLDIRLTFFRGNADMKYYIDLREHSDGYRGVQMYFTRKNNLPSS